MEVRAPAAGEHALVPLDESCEVAECLRRERLDREVGHAWQRTRHRGPSASGGSRGHSGVNAVTGALGFHEFVVIDCKRGRWHVIVASDD